MVVRSASPGHHLVHAVLKKMLRIVAALTGEELCETFVPSAGPATVGELKGLLEGQLGIPACEQHLVLGTTPLQNRCKLQYILGTRSQVVTICFFRRDPLFAETLQRLRSGKSNLSNVDPAYRENREVVLAAVAFDGNAVQHASAELKRDTEVLLAAVRQNYAALQHAPWDVLCCKIFMRKAVSQDYRCLQYTDPATRSDMSVVQAAVAESPQALTLVNNGEKSLVLAAVSKCGRALQHASKKLKSDTDVVMAAVTNDGSALMYADAKRRSDYDVVLAAVKSHGRVLQVAPSNLRACKEIVLAAVSSCGMAIVHASEDLQIDQDVLLEAIRQDRHILARVPQHLFSNKEFSIEAAKLQARTLKYVDASISGSDVVQMAVSHDGKAIRYVAKKEDVIEILKKTPSLYRHLSSQWKEDADIMQLAGVFAHSRRSRPRPQPGRVSL